MAKKSSSLTDEEFIYNTNFYQDIEWLIEDGWDPYEAAEDVLNRSCYSEKVKGILAIKALEVYDSLHDTNYADGIGIEEEDITVDGK